MVSIEELVIVTYIQYSSYNGGLRDDSNSRTKRYFSILVQFWYSVNCPKVSVLTFVHFTVMGLSPSAVQTNLTRGSLMAALIL